MYEPPEEMPAEGTIENCQYTTYMLVQALNDEAGLELPLTDIDSIVQDQQGIGTFEDGLACHIGNLRLMAVREYKIRNGIRACTGSHCGGADIIGPAMWCKTCIENSPGAIHNRNR